MMNFVGSAEMRGGLALAYLTFSAGMVLVLAIAGGAFSGLLRDRRQTARQAE